MSVIGSVDSLWRYPVKSMRGEQCSEFFVGFAGVYGDRLFALQSSAAPKGFPYLTGRNLNELLLYHPEFKHPLKAAKPGNLEEAERLAPGLNLSPAFADSEDLAMTVETPSGQTYAIDDPALIEVLEAQLKGKHSLTLVRSERSMTDCRPLSLFSIQTADQLSDEVGIKIDQRRFRANVYLDLKSNLGFQEDALVGKTVQVGPRAVVAILERDPRCAMITYDPDSAETNADVLRQVNQAHEGMAGVYAAVLVEGMVREGDEVTLLS
ncbi:MAG: MOSC domain-containing protein [Proteobacteria bacterium]|nr:MOSC domain-containing protein [Pseudomonadota bacterium]